MVRELTGPTGDTDIIIFLNRHNIKLPSFSIEGQLSEIIRKVPFAQWIVISSQLVRGQAISVYEMPSHKGDISTTLLQTKTQGPQRRSGRKMLRARGWVGPSGNGAFWTWRMDAIVNSQQVGLPAQGLLRSSQSTPQHEGREGLMVLHLYLRTYLMSSGGEESTAFTGVVLGRLTPHPCVWATQIGLGLGGS